MINFLIGFFSGIILSVVTFFWLTREIPPKMNYDSSE